MKKILTTALIAGIAASSLSADITEVSTEIITDTTWTADNQYILTNIVYVKNGATLTIEPGTIVRGNPRTGTSTFDPGALVITTGGRINAVGEPNNPIIFTTAALDGEFGTTADGIADGIDVETVIVEGDEVRNVSATRWTSGTSEDFLDFDPLNSPLPPALYNGDGTIQRTPDPDSGDPDIAIEYRQLWGGIIILGEAPVNTFVTDAGGLNRQFIEGLPKSEDAAFGGFNPNDNSGALAYVSIRHGGAVIGAANELNGLTMGGVGFGTRIDHIEVYCNADDGFEWFGGTVNTKYLASVFNNDDGFDHDEGFTGLGQFWFNIFNNDGVNGDKAAEHDGETGDANSLSRGSFSVSLPKTFPVIYNATYIGGGELNTRSTEAFRIRDNWGGAYYNSIFADFKGDAIEIELDGLDRLNIDGEVIFHETTWFGFGGADTAAAYGKAQDSGIGALDAANELVVDGIWNDSTNRILDPDFATFNRRLANGVNPVPTLNAGTANNGTSFGESETSTFFDNVAYKGAFPTDKTATLWTTGWTALNKRGILVDRGDGLSVD
jgi:hypothetical protein